MIKKMLNLFYLKFKEYYYNMKTRDWIFLFLILIGAVLFRLILMTKAYAIGFDEVNYLKLAASGKINGLNHVLHPYWPPFYPVMVALFSFIVPDFEMAGRLFSILCGTIVTIPLFFFIKNLFDKNVAFWTILLVAFFTTSALYSIRAETEFCYSLFGLMGIMIGWTVLEKGQLWLGMLVGVFFGFAYLTKPEGIGFFLVYIGIIAIVIVYRKITKIKISSFILIFILVILGFGVVSIPYIFYLRTTTGQWTISAKADSNQKGEIYAMTNKTNRNVFRMLNSDNTSVPVDEIFHIGNFLNAEKERDQEIIKVTTKLFITKVSKNLYKLLTGTIDNVLTLPILLLLILGLFGEAWSKKILLINLYLLAFLLFFWFILIPVFHINNRYFIPLIPVSFIWVGVGIERLINWLDKTINSFSETVFLNKKIAAALVLITIVGLSILPTFLNEMQKDKFSSDEWRPCIEQKKAGLWLKENGVKEPIIMSVNHAVSFYAGNYNIAESVTIPDNNIDRVLEYLKNRGVHYIVLNDRYKHKYPTLSFLLDRINIPSNLKLIYYDQDKNGLRTLIYEVGDNNSGK